MKDKKNKNFEIFCNLIKNANKVILLDAFITNRTLNLIKAIDGKELAGELLYNEIPINKKIVFKTAQGSEDIFNEIIANAKDCTDDKEKQWQFVYSTIERMMILDGLYITEPSVY
jgi:hypothetical protein